MNPTPIDIPIRLNPMRWAGEERANGVFLGSGQPEPTLIDMPAGVRRAQPRLACAGELGTVGSAFLLRLAMRLLDLDPEEDSDSMSLAALPELDRAILEDLWGEGEVGIEGIGSMRYSARESVFPGLWRVRVSEPQGGPWSDRLELGAIPGFVRRLAHSATHTELDLAPVPMAGLMNAAHVLAEVRARASGYRLGQPNHVVNFTLLPLSSEDGVAIVRTLGEGGLSIRSGGYGSCRIVMTQLRHVWSVQYLNSTGAVILDTLEVGDVPRAALAAKQDFEDSARRLSELAQACVS